MRLSLHGPARAGGLSAASPRVPSRSAPRPAARRRRTGGAPPPVRPSSRPSRVRARPAARCAAAPADHAGLDAEEPADAVRRLPGRVPEVAVADQEHLLAREQPVQVVELLAVAAEGGVVPEVRPARGDPLGLAVERRREVRLGFQARVPQVRPVRVGALRGVPQHGDEPGVGQELADPRPGRRGRRGRTPSTHRTAPRPGPRRTAPRSRRGSRRARPRRGGRPAHRPRRAADRRSGRTSAPWARTGTVRGGGPARRAVPTLSDDRDLSTFRRARATGVAMFASASCGREKPIDRRLVPRRADHPHLHRHPALRPSAGLRLHEGPDAGHRCFRAESIVFERAYSHGPLTLPVARRASHRTPAGRTWRARQRRLPLRREEVPGDTAAAARSRLRDRRDDFLVRAARRNRHQTDGFDF